MPVAINSISAYYGLDLTERQADVVRALQILGMATDEQIANYLGYTVNRVTGRVCELIEKGAVVIDHDVIGPFGKTVRVTRLKNTSGMLFE